MQQHTIYVLEPQALFVSELMRIVIAAGGHVARTAECLDVEEIASVRAEYGLLDLDYTACGVLDGLALFRGAAPHLKPIVLTDEHDFDRLARYREAGAAVLSKSVSAEETVRALGDLFESGAQRVNRGPASATRTGSRTEERFAKSRARRAAAAACELGHDRRSA